MGIKVNQYTPISSYTTSTAAVSETPEQESFQDVLVLNQSALKAMTIDAMVAESETGAINPDAVNAAAIMKFRSTLGSNIQAPVPDEDWDGGGPKKISKPQVSAPADTSTPAVPAADTSDVYNSGNLACNDALNAYFKEAADTYGVDVKLLKSIAYVESRFTTDCTSSAGAMGVMQLMPNTAKGLGVEDAYDARQNILGGAKYISNLLERYDGDTSLALAAYNAGSGNVKKYDGIPPFAEGYVNKVLDCYNV